MSKKLLTAILTIGLIFGLMAGPAMAEMKDMWAYVYTWDGKLTADGKMQLTRQTENISFWVMAVDSLVTLETLYEYNDNAYTALTNPVTGTNFTSATVCNDMISFRVDPTDATDDRYVDLYVTDQDGGFSIFIENFDEFTHAIIIDERPGIIHHGFTPILTTTSSTEVDTGIDFPANCVIHDFAIFVATAISGGAASSEINVGLLAAGTNGDADGFIVAEHLATVGWHNLYYPMDTMNILSTGGEAAALIYAPAIGTYLGHFIVGTSDTDISRTPGFFERHPLYIYGTWERSLTYTFSTREADDGWGLIHYWFTKVH